MKSIALLIFLVPLAAVAQDRIEGLVEITALHSYVNSGVLDKAIGPVPLFAEPIQEAEVAVVVRNRRQLESYEHGYEQVSAAVYDVDGDQTGFTWYKLRYIGEGGPIFGWLNQTYVERYRNVSGLVRSGLAHLTSEWDGRLFEAPNLDSPAELLLDLKERQSVRVIQAHRRNFEPRWYLIAIVSGTCTGEPLEVITTGWVPAYSDSGGNTVWFSSRGC